MNWELYAPSRTSATLFPEGFMEGASCIRYSWRQVHEIIEYCKSIGQEWYNDLVGWTKRREANWCYIYNGCLHADSYPPNNKVEYSWEELLQSDNNPVCQLEDVNVLL